VTFWVMESPLVQDILMKILNSILLMLDSFLRKTCIDELLHLINILMGDMTFVDPRPALCNLDDLIALLTA